MSYAVYIYADANKFQQKIRADEVLWNGAWSSTGTYLATRLDAISYATGRYVAIYDSVNVTPTQVLPNRKPNPWSLLVVYQAGDEPPFGPPVYPGFGTVSTAAISNGTIAYSFTGPETQATTVDQDLGVSVANATPGLELNLVLVPDGNPHNLTYGPFQWFDTSPPATILDKTVLLTLVATDTAVLAKASVAI